ncbi:MAG: purine-nucleoside phosphorylase [Clostridia bacterium]|nr:purine-nucleoside phosphorylase [Clostridia bacterium]
MENLEQCVIDAVSYIKSVVPFKPDIAIVSGKYLETLVYELQNPIEIPYGELPYFKGDNGKLVFGQIYDKNVVIMVGNVHYYEGYSMQDVVFPIRVFALLGIEDIIFTTSAGGISPKYKTGDIVLITDHINLSFESPLRGPNCSILGNRFPSLKDCYSKSLMDVAKKVSYEIGVNLQEGVYAFVTGPQYETNAEVKMLSTLGASMVGMSTVPEVIAATHSGMEILALACITNSAGDLGDMPERNEILESASKIEEDYKAIVMDTIKKIVIETEG